MTAGADIASLMKGGQTSSVRAGPLSATLSEGAVRWVRCGDVEVVRAIDYPIRDADWATLATCTADEALEEGPDGFTYRRRFTVGDGALSGVFTLDRHADALVATLTLFVDAPITVNRAGFVLLHPLAGVAGTPLERIAPDGTRSGHSFPASISPGQPVFDIAGLDHAVGGVRVRIAFGGEVFEMEDQRNWTDASFKTYCRALALPRPYLLEPGTCVEQRITIELADGGASHTTADVATDGTAPELTLAFEPALSPLDETALAALAVIPFAAVQVRLRPDDAAAALAEARRLGLPVELEVVLPHGTPPEPALRTVAEACAAQGIEPRRVLALPEGYLASVQPEGPWPDGATPAQAAEAVRAAFPRTEVGAGALTNFTELNRCRPSFPSDYVSFGTTAIVHAADDASVVETLEALPAVFSTAAEIAGPRPLRLGLAAIAMRSNPYGASVAANPLLRRVTMAMDDPRQATSFAAAFAVGLSACAARAGVASLSPAMATGPLGLIGDGGRVHPLFHVVAALARLAGHPVRVEGSIPGGLVTIVAEGRGVAANFSHEPFALTGPAAIVPDDGAPDWSTTATPTPGLVLQPMTAAVLFAEAA